MIIYSLESRFQIQIECRFAENPAIFDLKLDCKSFKKLIEGWTFLRTLWFGGVMTRDLKTFGVFNKHNELGSTAFDYPTYLLSKVFLSFLFLALYDQITPCTPEIWVLQLNTFRFKSFRFLISEIQKIWQKFWHKIIIVLRRFTFEAAESSL